MQSGVASRGKPSGAGLDPWQSISHPRLSAGKDLPRSRTQPMCRPSGLGR